MTPRRHISRPGLTLIEIVIVLGSLALGVLAARAAYTATDSFWISAGAAIFALHWFPLLQLVGVLATHPSGLKEFALESTIYFVIMPPIALASTLVYVQTESFIAALVASIAVFALCIAGWAAYSRLTRSHDGRLNDRAE